jgi:mono/diheme cytochrome c family protein
VSEKQAMMTRYRMKIASGIAALALAGASHAAVRVPQRDSVTSAPKAILQQYCIGCHSKDSNVGGFALDTADISNPAQHPEIWEKVIKKLRARMMPPPGRPRPDESTYSGLVSYLETSIDRAALAKPNPGRVETFRRLTQTEYHNAIRDLLGMDLDVSSMIPSDDTSQGFDNITSATLSPTLLERYLSASQKISRLAVGNAPRTPAGETFVLPADLTQEDHVDDLPFGTRGGAAIRYTFPVNGEYELQIRLTRDRNEHVEGLTEAHQMEVSIDGERVQMFSVAPPPRAQGPNSVSDDDIDAGLHLRADIKAGPHVVGVTFLKKSSALLETERQPYQAHFNMDRHPRIQPAVYSVSITGPYLLAGAGETPSRSKIFSCHPAKVSEPAKASGDDACARKILETLARRAYRRPVNEQDLEVPLSLYKGERAESGFEAGIEVALRALLVSPGFLFRVEQEPSNIAADTAYRITDLELASRLSFFLWSSIPDDELLDLAIRGKLKDPATLERQVQRMLADARSQSLATNFADQWLSLRKLPGIIPDVRLFPDFDDNLRQSFRTETELFFDSMLHENRSALDLLRANYTFLNERLAKHYGIPNVYGSQFRRVEFKDGLNDFGNRAGLLGQGSVLTVTSYANRTSPVLRGKWVLSNVLGMPPPQPPPNVPPLKESTGKALTMRERMTQHRANPACSGCHQLMDPIGFSLENFDAVGRWRGANEDGSAVDASGGLPDGSAFNGIEGLRSAVLNRPEIFLTNLTEKLMTYALGRGVEYSDAPAIRRIVRDAHTENDHLSALIAGIVKSAPFQMRRSK